MRRDFNILINFQPHKPKHDGGQRHKKRVRQPHNTRERLRHIVIEQGEHLMPGQEYIRPGIVSFRFFKCFL